MVGCSAMSQQLLGRPVLWQTTSRDCCCACSSRQWLCKGGSRSNSGEKRRQRTVHSLQGSGSHSHGSSKVAVSATPTVAITTATTMHVCSTGRKTSPRDTMLCCAEARAGR